MAGHVPLVLSGDRAAWRDGDTTQTGTTQTGTIADLIAYAENAASQRWIVASAREGLAPLVAAGVPVARVWDLAEAHRLIFGGWRADLPYAWAMSRGLDPAGMPSAPSGDLFDFANPAEPQADPDSALTAAGYLRPNVLTGWASTGVRLDALLDVLAELASWQLERCTALGPRTVATVHSESAAALLCLELERDGLPIERTRVLELIGQAAGPRPRDEADAARIRSERDEEVLRHARPGSPRDLRNPAQVKAMLEANGIHVDNTRKWELDPYRASSPLVAALLEWRKDERVATTYGYRWLDAHVGPDDRLRGGWTACDGAAGRMTAANGLHNLPIPLRPAVVAEPGHLFIRADLGQIEPRVLAVVSGDRSFAAATQADDLYAPVAAKLGVERAVAKIAVLAAMYGQRSGSAGDALKDLERAYPIAMGVLDQAYAAGVARQSIRTFGGRLIQLDQVLAQPDSDPESPSPNAAALNTARGRYARNAIIQGSAAELFKAWAATVRHTVRPLGGQIVLCLHDELLVQVPRERAEEAVTAVSESLTASSRRWSHTDAVRFVADTKVIESWDEAKD